MQQLFRIGAMLIAVTALMVTARSASAGTMQNIPLGYNFWIPDDWVQIPQAEVDAMQARLITQNMAQKISFCAAYQPASNTQSFEYPYLVVQSTSYQNGAHIQSISEAELKKTVAAINGMKESDVEKTMTPEATKLLGRNSNGIQAVYFLEPPGFRIDVKSTGSAVTFRGATKALIGKDRALSVNCYALDKDWATYQPTFDKIHKSFQLLPIQQATLTTSRPVDPAYLIGGAVGVIFTLAIVIAVVKKVLQ